MKNHKTFARNKLLPIITVLFLASSVFFVYRRDRCIGIPSEANQENRSNVTRNGLVGNIHLLGPPKREISQLVTRIQSLSDFKKSYATNRKSLSSLLQRQESNRLLQEATMILSLEDFKEFCNQLEGIDEWQTGLGLLGGRYGTEDPEGGFAWLLTLTTEPGAAPAFSSFAAEIGPSYDDRILNWAVSLDHQSVSDALFNGVISKGGDASIISAIEMINKTPNKVLCSTAARITEKYMRDGDYNRALQLANGFEDETNRWNSLNGIMRHLGDEDPVKGSQLLMNIENDKDKSVVVGTIVERWVRIDPKASSAWVSSLSPSEPKTKDAAISAIATSMIGFDDRGAFNWAQSISDRNVRDRATDRVLGVLKSNNPKEYEILSRKIR